jgi:hypothetical protein
MTPITRKLVRITKATFRGAPIVIELHATAIFLRTKGSRDSFPLSYAELFDIAALRDAKRKTGFAGRPRLTRAREKSRV